MQVRDKVVSFIRPSDGLLCAAFGAPRKTAVKKLIEVNLEAGSLYHSGGLEVYSKQENP